MNEVSCAALGQPGKFLACASVEEREKNVIVRTVAGT